MSSAAKPSQPVWYLLPIPSPIFSLGSLSLTSLSSWLRPRPACAASLLSALAPSRIYSLFFSLFCPRAAGVSQRLRSWVLAPIPLPVKDPSFLTGNGVLSNRRHALSHVRNVPDASPGAGQCRINGGHCCYDGRAACLVGPLRPSLPNWCLWWPCDCPWKASYDRECEGKATAGGAHRWVKALPPLGCPQWLSGGGMLRQTLFWETWTLSPALDTRSPRWLCKASLDPAPKLPCLSPSPGSGLYCGLVALAAFLTSCFFHTVPKSKSCKFNPILAYDSRRTRTNTAPNTGSGSFHSLPLCCWGPVEHLFWTKHTY